MVFKRSVEWLWSGVRKAIRNEFWEDIWFG